MSFDTALNNYIALLTERNTALAANDHHRYRYTYSVGVKWVRIIIEPCLSMVGTQPSVHTFVDSHTGDIHFASSWKAPSKRVVGSILAADPLVGTTCGGGKYAR